MRSTRAASAAGRPRSGHRRSAHGTRSTAPSRSARAATIVRAPPPARSRAVCHRGADRSLVTSASSSARSGRALLARSQNNIAASSATSDGVRHTSSPGTPSGSRLVTMSLTCGHHVDDRVDEVGDGVEDVFGVVEHEQRRPESGGDGSPPARPVLRRRRAVSATPLPRRWRPGHRSRWPPTRSTTTHPHSCRPTRSHERQGEPGLTASTGSGERRQPADVDQVRSASSSR